MTLQYPPFSEVLRLYRTKKVQMSSSDVARSAGLSDTHISRLEHGVRAPSRETVDTLARAMRLGVFQHDTLLASAGYLPNHLSSLVASSVISDLNDVLIALEAGSDAQGNQSEDYKEFYSLLAACARFGRLLCPPSGPYGDV